MKHNDVFTQGSRSACHYTLNRLRFQMYHHQKYYLIIEFSEWGRTECCMILGTRHLGDSS